MTKRLILISVVVLLGSSFIYSLFGKSSIDSRQQYSQNFKSEGYAGMPAYPNYIESKRTQDAISAINNARSLEGLNALDLPNDFYSMDAVSQQFVLVNLERTDRGLSAYQLDPNLSQIAANYARQLSDPNLKFFAHVSPIAGDFGERMGNNPFIQGNFSIASENLAGNPVAGAGAMYEYLYNDSLESYGHRKNILDPDLHYIGIGEVANTQYGSASTQEFLASTSYQGTSTQFEAPSIKISGDLKEATLSLVAYTNVEVGIARITWFLDQVDSKGTLGQGDGWSLDLTQVTGAHTIFAYVVDGVQNYAVASYTFSV